MKLMAATGSLLGVAWDVCSCGGIPMKMLGGLAAAAVAMAFAGAAQAALVFNITEVGNDLVLTGSGSLNTAGLSGPLGGANSTGYIDASNALLRVGGGPIAAFSGVTGYSSQNPWGTSGWFATGTNTGPAFGLNAMAGYVFLPDGYVSGAVLNATSTFANQSLARQALSPGAYTYAVPNDTITLNIGQQGAVPEPTSWAMMIGGFGLIGVGLRRQKTISFS